MYLHSIYFVTSWLDFLVGSFDEICGCGALSDAPGELCINFEPGSVNGCADIGPDCKAEYWVQETDYVSYVAEYYCEQILELKRENAWILTRDPNPAQEVVSIIH